MIYGIIASEPSKVPLFAGTASFPADDFFAVPSVARKTALYIDSDQFYSPLITSADPVAFVNATGGSQGSSATSGSPALPGSLVNDNVILAIIQVSLGSQTVVLDSGSLSNGWLLADSITDVFISSAVAWRVVDGTETAPTFTWGASANYVVNAVQYTNNDPASPIGDIVTASDSDGHAVVGALTTTADQSAAIAVVMQDGYDFDFAATASFTLRDNFSHSSGSHTVSDESIVGSGNTSDGVDQFLDNSAWHGYLIEIRGA